MFGFLWQDHQLASKIQIGRSTFIFIFDLFQLDIKLSIYETAIYGLMLRYNRPLQGTIRIGASQGLKCEQMMRNCELIKTVKKNLAEFIRNRRNEKRWTKLLVNKEMTIHSCTFYPVNKKVLQIKAINLETLTYSYPKKCMDY